MKASERLSKKLAAIRKSLGLSTYELGEVSGMKQSHISRLEKGTRSASVDTFENLAQAMGYTVDIVPTAPTST